MDRQTLKLICGDTIIIAIFVLGPGFRGYANWQIHEYLLMVVIAVTLIQIWHKTNRQNDMK